MTAQRKGFYATRPGTPEREREQQLARELGFDMQEPKPVHAGALALRDTVNEHVRDFGVEMEAGAALSHDPPTEGENIADAVWSVGAQLERIADACIELLEVMQKSHPAAMRVYRIHYYRHDPSKSVETCADDIRADDADDAMRMWKLNEERQVPPRPRTFLRIEALS